MPDVVVTLPLSFRYGGLKGLAAWIAEGDAAGDPIGSGGVDYYTFTIGGGRPRIGPGERVYVVYNRRLRGYAPLIKLQRSIGMSRMRWELIRAGAAVAVTIPEEITGFRGWRYRWWNDADETPFPDWKIP